MDQTGILIHVYHLEAKGWENLVWGDPEYDKLGTLPKLVELLLRESASEPATTILIYSGPSEKDGLTEGAYTKRYLLEHFEDLWNFPSLNPRLTKLSSDEVEGLRKRLEGIVVGPVIRNTREEVQHAAIEFQKRGINKVTQLAAASHAPRCVQSQLIIRNEGFISSDQIWSVVTSDTYFEGTTAEDLLILEPPHRGDDPMAKMNPSAPQVLKAYLELDRFKKQHFIASVEQMLENYKDQRL
jgi:hypothetical protein